MYHSCKHVDSRSYAVIPENCDRENQNHSRNHIRYRKLLDLTHSKAGRQHDKAAARLEVVDDVGIGSKIQSVVNRAAK